MVKRELHHLGLVVTTYNASKYLDQFLGWYELSHEYFGSVVIVDDASSDESFITLKKNLAAFDCIKFIGLLENSGRPSIPRNIALDNMHAVRVVFLDIDDLLPLEYIKFLASEKSLASDDVYSGTKFSVYNGDFNCFYQPDFSRFRIVSKDSQSLKNQIVFSGASVPLWRLKKVRFINSPLEDWFFWKQVANNGDAEVKFIRFLDVPIGYNSSATLSPAKYKQLKRVKAHLSISKMLSYFLLVLRMKFEEFSLRMRME